jgi:hypothetical protein
MRAVITLALTVDVPDGTELARLYLDLPTEQVEVLSLESDQPVDAIIQGYETLDVSGEHG